MTRIPLMRQKAGQFLTNYIRQIHDMAETLLTEPLSEVTEELFALFEKNGNRLKYEEVYFGRRKFLALYGMAVIVPELWQAGRPKNEYVQKLTEIISSVCREECWALPAHVNRRENADWRYTVDLFASETAQTLSELVTLGRAYLPEELYDEVKEQVEKRVLVPFFSSSPPYASWEGCGHNWNAVCIGAIGSAALYLWKEREELPVFMKRLEASLAHYVDGFEEDGTCMEGIGYFTYGMTYFTGFAKQLYDESNGKENLFLLPKLENIAQFQQKMYFQSGRTVSFSDGETKAKFRMGLTLLLAQQYEGVSLPDERLACDFNTDNCYRFMGLYRDYVWVKEFLEQRKNDTAVEKTSELVQKMSPPENVFHARHSVLPAAQWSICESRNGAGVAVKGGHNDEPHNHNDIAGFLYLSGEEFLLTDLGAGEYTKEYFSSGRYEILCNSALGHSVPVVNGTLQKAGRQYASGEFFADGNGRTRIEFSGAYEKGLLKQAVRELAFDMENGTLCVKDSFEADMELSVTEQLVTQYPVEIVGNIVNICGEHSALTIELPKYAKDVRFLEKPHRNHEGGDEVVRLIQWDVPAGKQVQTEFTIERVVTKNGI